MTRPDRKVQADLKMRVAAQHSKRHNSIDFDPNITITLAT